VRKGKVSRREVTNVLTRSDQNDCIDLVFTVEVGQMYPSRFFMQAGFRSDLAAAFV
jgi:hypothetical protein